MDFLNLHFIVSLLSGAGGYDQILRVFTCYGRCGEIRMMKGMSMREGPGVEREGGQGAGL